MLRAEELARIRKVLAVKAIDDPEYAIQVGAVAEAEKAAKEGDERKVLSYLAKVGRSVLSVAKAIGTDVAEKFIERAVLGPGS